MEYIDLIRKFWKINNESPLNISVAIIYLYLLECWDRNQKQNFEISDVELSEKLKISRKTIKSSKDILRNLGIINFRITSGFPTSYEIITDYVFNSKKTQKSISKAPKKSSEKPPKKEVEVSPITPFVSAPKEEPNRGIANPTQNDINLNIPSLEEFMQFAKTIEIYNENLDFAIKSKYESWKENGWKNGFNAPIKNWKQSLKNAFPFLGKTQSEPFKIPTIYRPKQTYNE